MNILLIILYILDYIICGALGFIFIQYYVSKKVPKLYKILSVFFLFANYLLIFTLPYEIIYYNAKKEFLEKRNNDSNNFNVSYGLDTNISETNQTENETNSEIKNLNGVLSLNYTIIFFVLVTLSGQVIIILIQYEKSGEFGFWRKVLGTIKSYIKMMIIFYAIFGILSIVLKDIFVGLFLLFNIITMSYAFAFLGVSMVKFPRNMYIHSNSTLALEYYEYKAYKKYNKLNKNNEELKKIFIQCKKTLGYMKNIEEFLKNNNKNSENEENSEEKDELKDNNNDDYLKNDTLNNNEFEEKYNDEENNNKEEIKEDKKIEKDYKDHKSILKNKKYIEIFYSNISEIIKNNNIEVVEDFVEEPIKEYKKIVSLNAKSKELNNDNERINSQMKEIFNRWAFLKECSIEGKSNHDTQDKNVSTSEKDVDDDINVSLNENTFISSNKISIKKIQLYQKFHKPIYIFLMIFFIFLDIIILLSEISLITPKNLSFLSLILRNISNPILVQICGTLLTSLFFIYVSYSFGKISIMGGSKNIIFGGKQTNSLSLLTYCQKLSTVSFPLSMNIIFMIFHNNVDKELKTILEENYGPELKKDVFYKIFGYIPLFIIIVIIFSIFDIKKRICRKKKESFYIKNEFRDKNIAQGKQYLIKLNGQYLEELEIKV